MNDVKSLSHTSWNCKYHIVFDSVNFELTLMNQFNVTMNKAQKITYGMSNGEIDLSEG